MYWEKNKGTLAQRFWANISVITCLRLELTAEESTDMHHGLFSLLANSIGFLEKQIQFCRFTQALSRDLSTQTCPDCPFYFTLWLPRWCEEKFKGWLGSRLHDNDAKGPCVLGSSDHRSIWDSCTQGVWPQEEYWVYSQVNITVANVIGLLSDLSPSFSTSNKLVACKWSSFFVQIA